MKSDIAFFTLKFILLIVAQNPKTIKEYCFIFIKNPAKE